MDSKKLFCIVVSTFIMTCFTDIFAQRKNVVHGHLYEYSYSSDESKDTLGRSKIYMPEAKSDMDRETPPGMLPQYINPNYYGYKKLKHNDLTNSNNNISTPRFGEKVSKRRATKNSFAIRHSDGIYYYRNGIFYLEKKDMYEIHLPQIGFRVPSIPTERREYMIGDVAYYYYYGTFYVFNSFVKMFDVVEPPIGGIVDWIPDDAEKRMIDGELIYIDKGIQYKELSLSMGAQKWYQIIAVESK